MKGRNEMDLSREGGGGDGPEGGMERWVWLTAGTGLLTVVLLAVLDGLGRAGNAATSGIAVVGTITTAAFGVLALIVRRRRR